MIDISKLQYRTILIQQDGTQLDVTEVTDNLGYEEGAGEMAMRLYCTLYNKKINGVYLSKLAALGSPLSVIADWGSGTEEVARCNINEWSPTFSNSTTDLDLTAYDNLYSFQQSQDNYYFPAGTGTKAAITQIFGDWGIPVREYSGPDVTHERTVCKNQYLGSIVSDFLEDAKNRTGIEGIIRCRGGMVDVVAKGSNRDIYHFDEDTNAILVRDRHSITNLITRIKVVGKEDSDKRPPVEGVVDGRTEFGIRQRIFTRTDGDLSTAIRAANEMLENSGSPERDISFEGPDVPFIRKGDKVHIRAGTLNGYYFVTSIRHDCANRWMTMTLEETQKPPVNAPIQDDTEDFQQGDTVILNGPVYVDSYGNGKGRTFTDYRGTITIKVDPSRSCPYHIDHIGWVYPSDLTRV